MCTYISNLFPPKLLRMTWNSQFCLAWKFSNLFPLKWFRMTWNGQFQMICNFLHFFPQKSLRMPQNGQFHPICKFSNLFPPKQLRITCNSQFYPIHNFSNLFPPKQLRMTWIGQFHLICNFSNLFIPKRIRMPWNGQFCLIGKIFQSFPTEAAHNHVEQPILPNSQTFHFGGCGYVKLWSCEICHKIFLPDFQLFISWEGVHLPKPKCHLDLKSNFFIPGEGREGGTSARTKNVTLT